MELPNTNFTDFPIDFKQINPSDFPEFSVNEKTIIQPDSEGYILESLLAKIDLNEKNTVVVNAAVGQGKTTAILEIVKKIYDTTDYLIFIASPFVSLVEQYYNKTVGLRIPEDDIYRYEWIGKNRNRDAWDSRIQIVTANCLLGNPGNDSIVSAVDKRKYINYLSNKCNQNNRKVVFIYHEIHDSIHNFHPRFVFSLWKWRGVIHKNFILSATFNEASKTVIEYLGELTDKKIKIIESERTIQREKQSSLHLHFVHSKKYTNDTDALESLVRQLVAKGKSIDILSFSRVLADSICKEKSEGVGKILFDAFGEVNRCTSELEENTPLDADQTLRYSDVNRFNHEKDICNVGTNFKSGVSIEKDNHAFIIILPPFGRRYPFKSAYGIFTDGINSVTQALARQRKKGEIHVVLPKPDKFDFETLPFTDEVLVKAFSDYYSLHQNNNTKDVARVKYYSQNQQQVLLADFYDENLLQHISDEKVHIEQMQRDNLPSLLFPTYKDFRLEHGEQYLATKVKIFGRDLSSFVLFSAITNQFSNCYLEETNIKPPLFFEEGKIQWKLSIILKDYLEEDYYNSLIPLLTDKYIYHEIKNQLFSEYTILFKNPDGQFSQIYINQNKYFEQQLLTFVQIFLYPRNKIFKSKVVRDNGFISDHIYDRGEYFRSCISHAINMDKEGISSPLISAFLFFKELRDKMILRIRTTGRNDQKYLPNEPFEGFITDGDYELLRRTIAQLSEHDYLITNEIYDFKNVFSRSTYSDEKKITALYNYLRFDFFNRSTKRINNSEMNSNVYIIREIYSIPDHSLTLNFISGASFKISEDNFPTLQIDEDGKTFLKNMSGDFTPFTLK